MPDQTPRHGLDLWAQGETGWDHTDAIELFDELSIERGPIGARPASGEYDDELYLADDQLTLYQWDAGAGTWDAVAGLGTAGSPLPFYASTLNGADVENAAAGTVPTAQGDGSFSMDEVSGGGSAAKVELAQQTGISGQSAIEFPSLFDSTDDYKAYIVEAYAIGPDTEGEQLLAEVTTDDGSTWDSSSGYWAHHGWYSSESTSVSRARGGPIKLADNAGNTSDRRGSCKLELHQPTASWNTTFHGEAVGRRSGGQRYGTSVDGRFEGIGGLTGVRLLASTGAITADVAIAYGLR